MTKKRILAWLGVVTLFLLIPLIAFSSALELFLSVTGVVVFGYAFVSLVCYGTHGIWPWENPYDRREGDG